MAMAIPIHLTACLLTVDSESCLGVAVIQGQILLMTTASSDTRSVHGKERVQLGEAMT